MGQCACHPDIETRFLCIKHNLYLCEECLKCQNPELYCKFRSACPIWFLGKKGAKELLSDDAGTAEDIKKAVSNVEILGDADEVQDIFSAVHAGYELASRY